MMRIYLFFMLFVMPTKIFAVEDVNYLIVDTVSNVGQFEYFIDAKSHWFHIRDINRKEFDVLSLDFMESLWWIDGLKLAEKYHRDDKQIWEYLPLRPMTKSEGEYVPAKFQTSPKAFVRILVKGTFFNSIMVSIDGPYEKGYPFKDPTAFYWVYFPIWDHLTLNN